MTDRYENIRKALISFDACGSHYWRDELARECDPDTIRALLAERDALAENLIGCMEALASHAPDCIEVECARSAIAAANGGGNG